MSDVCTGFDDEVFVLARFNEFTKIQTSVISCASQYPERPPELIKGKVAVSFRLFNPGMLHLPFPAGSGAKIHWNVVS